MSYFIDTVLVTISSYLQDPSIRIYIIATYAAHARLLLCEVAPVYIYKN